jgi:hypothetical protein
MANTETGQGDTAERGARVYCSEHNTVEAMPGTADTVDVWLCLEYRPAWKPRVLVDNALSTETKTWLEDTLAEFAARDLKCRPQFVRQPETESDAVRLMLTVAGRTYQWSGSGYGYLNDLHLSDLVAAEARSPGTLGGAAEEVHATQYLVCTNGQRDLCCARFGLPVYAALKERVGNRVWQVTHLGGHRFAPNLLTLPDACLYGRVTPDDVDGFLARTEQGQVAFPYLRGRTCYPPAVQAAEALLGRDGLRLLHVEEAGQTTRVRFAAASESVGIDVQREASPQRVLKSCGDPEETEVFPFRRA